jgi:hypothetical protein
MGPSGSERAQARRNGTTSEGINEQTNSAPILADLATHVIRGIGLAGLMDFPVRITTADDSTIAFSGSEQLADMTFSVGGSIDRKTGELKVTSTQAAP